MTNSAETGSLGAEEWTELTGLLSESIQWHPDETPGWVLGEGVSYHLFADQEAADTTPRFNTYRLMKIFPDQRQNQARIKTTAITPAAQTLEVMRDYPFPNHTSFDAQTDLDIHLNPDSLEPVPEDISEIRLLMDFLRAGRNLSRGPS